MARMNNMGNILKIGIGTIVMVLALYNSVYIESLEEHMASQEVSTGLPDDLAKDFFTDRIPDLSYTEAKTLLNGIGTGSSTYIKEHGKKLGISDDHYFMVQATGTIQEIGEEDIVLSVDDTAQTIHVATSFIFGNAIREASGAFSIGDYLNTMDFNNISIMLNDHVREHVADQLLRSARTGQQLSVKGAVKVTIGEMESNPLRLIPVAYEIP